MNVRYIGLSNRRILSSDDIERSFGIEHDGIDVTRDNPVFVVNADLAAKLFETMGDEFAPQAARAVPPDSWAQPKDQIGNGAPEDEDDEIIDDEGDEPKSESSKARSATSHPKSRSPKAQR